MKKSYAYCTYHQIKDHVTIFCKALEVAILDLIDKGKYQNDQIDSNQETIVNTVLVDKEVCVGLQRWITRYDSNLITTKQSIPPNLNTYNVIKQLKTTPTKISYMILYLHLSHIERSYILCLKRRHSL